VGTVSSGSARRGRRDNGLDAAEYAAAGDVDPRVGEHLLDVLALQGIAAYLQPAVDLNPVTRNAVMPSRPTDRLFVDRAHLHTARDYLAQLAEPRDRGTPDAPTVAASGAAATDHAGRTDQTRRAADQDPRTPDPAGTAHGPADQTGRTRDQQGGRSGATGEPGAAERDDRVDDVWAEIVAGYDTEVDAAAAPWPEAENVSAERRPYDLEDTEEVDQPARPAVRPSQTEPPSLLTALDTFGRDLPDEPDDDEGYTPPPPPPLPRLSKYAVIGVLAIVVGFILFLKPSLLPIDADVSMLIGFAAILGGFGMLVWRLRPGDEDDYDPDDGARV
jgi:hypothetical protein